MKHENLNTEETANIDLGAVSGSAIRPPLGLIPKKFHDERMKVERFNEVCGAIARYYDAGLKINIEWIEEYNELVECVGSITANYLIHDINLRNNKLQIEVNASETQKYYKSKEVQDLDNPTDVVDEYESMENLDKMSIKNQYGFFAKPMLLAVISFFMRNLEFIPLCFALQFWFDAGNRWEYWVTAILVGTCSGISTAYNKYNNY